jgi:hypothetical protein
MARLDDGGCNGRSEEQGKPNQHEAGDEFGVSQGLHGMDYAKPS